jgi:hypothetical protein
MPIPAASDTVGELNFRQKFSKIESENRQISRFLPSFTMILGVRQQYRNLQGIMAFLFRCRPPCYGLAPRSRELRNPKKPDL